MKKHSDAVAERVSFTFYAKEPGGARVDIFFPIARTNRCGDLLVPLPLLVYLHAEDQNRAQKILYFMPAFVGLPKDKINYRRYALPVKEV